MSDDWDAVANRREASVAEAEAAVARDLLQDRLRELEVQAARRVEAASANLSASASSSDEEDPVLAESARLLAASARKPRRELLAQRTFSEEAEESEDDDVDDVDVNPPSQLSTCETLYRAEGRNSRQLLLSMALGLIDSETGRRLADWEGDDLYKNMPSKSSTHPIVPHMKREIVRRGAVLGIATRMRTASKNSCYEWLLNNPIQDPVDIAFLKNQEGQIYRALQNLAEEQAGLERDRLASASWTGDKPWLRFYCVLCHDTVRQALIDRDRAWSREELDARNNAERPPTFWAVAAALYNDPAFNPRLEARPDLHSSFSEAIELPLEEMPGGQMTAQDARSWFADCRGKLIQVRFLCTVDVFSLRRSC